MNVYETPSLFPIYYSDYARDFLQKTFATDIHLAEGGVKVLLGLKDHAVLSPNALYSHELLNLKLYQSVIKPCRKFVCGSIPSGTNNHNDEGTDFNIIPNQNNDILND